MRSRSWLSVIGSSALILAAGCDSSSESPDAGTDAAIEPDAGGGAEASIRVLHLSPDAPAVDVFANGEGPVVTELAFPSGTEYLTVPAGTYDFAVSATGSPASEAVLAIPGVALAEGRAYTAVAYDRLASITALALEDDLSEPASGNVRVRVVHTASGVGEVDVWNITNPSAPAPLVTDLAFGEAADALEVPAAAYVVGIDVDDDASPDVAFDIPSLPAGTIANVFAVADDAGVFLLAQLADGTTVRLAPRGPSAAVRVLHLSPDAPAVDVFVNGAGTPAIAGLELPDTTDYVWLPAGTYDFDVSASGSPASEGVLSIADLALEEGGFYTAVAHGPLASIAALALADDLAVPEGQIRVRAIHAAASVGQVDLWNVPSSGAPAPLWEDVDYGVAGDAIDLPPGAYTIGVDVDDDASPDLTFELPALAAGTHVNVYAVNQGDDVFLIVQARGGATTRIDPS